MFNYFHFKDKVFPNHSFTIDFHYRNTVFPDCFFFTMCFHFKNKVFPHCFFYNGFSAPNCCCLRWCCHSGWSRSRLGIHDEDDEDDNDEDDEADEDDDDDDDDDSVNAGDDDGVGLLTN